MILNADARHIPLVDESVDCCITSPPFWGLRDYGLGDSGIGLESTPEEYVANLVQVFREVWRVLKPQGTLWLNLGDSYVGGSKGHGGIENSPKQRSNTGSYFEDNQYVPDYGDLKSKDLVGIPWRVAFALQADGWYLRSDIIWAKPNPMPESVRDRPTKAHEYLFLLAKQARYYYDGDAIREPQTDPDRGIRQPDETYGGSRADRTVGDQFVAGWKIDEKSRAYNPLGRNRRTVWNIATQPYRGAHFATFPEKLVEPCILAGTKRGGIVLDPFCGSGTVGEVCRKHGRRFVGLDLSMKYLRELALVRAEGTQAAKANNDLPLFGAQ